MTSEKRKILLLAAFGAFLVFYSGEWLLNTVLRGPLEQKQTLTRRLEKKIDDYKKELSKARTAGKRLEAWEKTSLPSDPQVARSLYQAWLLELVNHVELTDPNVNSSEPANRKGQFYVLAFSIRGRGSLDTLTRFLFEFYRAGHLHQIRSLNITPMQKTDELDLAISIEAIVLPGSERKDSLSVATSDRLVSDQLESYQTIVDRNFFAVGREIDPTDQTFLTSVVAVEGSPPEAWFSLRSTDELEKLNVGDQLKVGQFSGRVAEITGSDVILVSEGQRWLLTIGECLTEAFALPPEF